MSEPVASALGLKISTAVFGFAGGIVSLAFIKDLTRVQAALSVVIGLVSSVALTPLLTAWTGFDHPGIENGVAFLIGLCAMSALPVLRNSVPDQLRKKCAALLGLPTE